MTFNPVTNVFFLELTTFFLKKSKNILNKTIHKSIGYHSLQGHENKQFYVQCSVCCGVIVANWFFHKKFLWCQTDFKKLLFPAFSIKLHNLDFSCWTTFLYLNIKWDSLQEHFQMFYTMEKLISVNLLKQPISFPKLPIKKSFKNHREMEQIDLLIKLVDYWISGRD